MLNAALVGLGWWGRNILKTLQGNAKLRVAAIVDPDPKVGEIARQAGVPFASDLNAVLADPKIDAVILCTPHTLHTDQVIRAAEAGKHVFCEKPLALKKRDAEASIAACRKRGRVLGLGHERRFEPGLAELQRLARTGALGTLLQIDANFSHDKLANVAAGHWRVSAAEAPAGPLTGTGIHLLDLAISLLGPADYVLANARQLGSSLSNGDTFGALVVHKSGANSLINAMLATPFHGRFAIFGNRAWAEVRDLAHPETPKGWTLEIAEAGSAPVRRDYGPADATRANLEAFADACAGNAPYPIAEAEMIATVAAFEAIVHSAERREMVRVEG
jgi:predicted dehydrogenase